MWGAGLALFAHVLVYPVTLAQPSPDPASLTTTLVSAGLYGALAVIFWLAFRRYDARILGMEAAAASEASPGTEDVPIAEVVSVAEVVSETTEPGPDIVEPAAEPSVPPAKRGRRKPPVEPEA